MRKILRLLNCDGYLEWVCSDKIVKFKKHAKPDYLSVSLSDGTSIVVICCAEWLARELQSCSCSSQP